MIWLISTGFIVFNVMHSVKFLCLMWHDLGGLWGTGMVLLLPLLTFDIKNNKENVKMRDEKKNSLVPHAAYSLCHGKGNVL